MESQETKSNQYKLKKKRKCVKLITIDENKRGKIHQQLH